jgi:hypothetical protein
LAGKRTLGHWAAESKPRDEGIWGTRAATDFG